MKGRHQADLIWRFLVADHQMAGLPSGLEVLKRHLDLCRSVKDKGKRESGVLMTEIQMAARERSERIDRVLARLPERLVRVLFLRYGAEETSVSLQEILPNMSGIAALTDAVKAAFERERGEPPRPRSHDAMFWLEALCHRISIRHPKGDDSATFADIVAEADQLLVRAEDAYEGWADRAAA